MDFNTMLDNVYCELESKTVQSHKLVLPVPTIIINGSNTHWTNVKKILILINRPPEHFVEYFNHQIGSTNWISSSKSDGLIIVGKHKIKQITQHTHEYIKKYVICTSCSSIDTVMEKNKLLRSYNIKCCKCNSNYNV